MIRAAPGAHVVARPTYQRQGRRFLPGVTDLDLARLRVFREVAVRGSFTAAATGLGLTQPAVSQQVAKLERELGAVLLERSTRTVRTTAPGRALLGHVEAVLTRLDDARREVAELADPRGGEVSLAAFPSASVTVLADVVAAWRAESGGCVKVSEADPPDALPGVLDGRFDLALAYDYPMLGAARDPRLEVTDVVHDPMAVALPQAHPLAARPGVALADLAGEAWVAPHDNGCHDALLLACRQGGLEPRIVAHTNDYLTMLGMVRAGLGVAVVPRLIAAGTGRVPDGVALVPLTGSRLARRVSVVRRTAGRRRAATDRLVAATARLLPTLARRDLPLPVAA